MDSDLEFNSVVERQHSNLHEEVAQPPPVVKIVAVLLESIIIAAFVRGSLQLLRTREIRGRFSFSQCQ